LELKKYVLLPFGTPPTFAYKTFSCKSCFGGSKPFHCCHMFYSFVSSSSGSWTITIAQQR